MSVRPDYYDEFVCIADKCDFTCCQEWKIAVDDETYEDWRRVDKELADSTTFIDEQRVMGLNKEGKCPYLTENKLCSLVLKHGEDFISNTCHIFPRETKEFDSHTEDNLVVCCPHVVDMLNKAETFYITGDDEAIYENEFFELRRRMIEFIQEDTSESVEEKLLVLFYILLECCAEDNFDEGLFDLNDELINTIENMETDPSDYLNECNELFLDIIENYRKEQRYSSLIGPLACQSEKLEKLLTSEDDTEALILHNRFSREFEDYEGFFKKLLAEEFFESLIIVDGDYETFVMKFEWLAMQYTCLKQMLFLYYMDNKKLDFDIVRQYTVLISRIMGYDDEDIFEYLENSFEEPVFEWGYLALLMVK